MKEIVEYRGFRIHVQSSATEAGKCRGTYELTAQSMEAEAQMAKSSIAGFGGGTMQGTDDYRATSPEMLSNQHLIEIAKSEVDMVLDKAT